MKISLIMDILVLEFYGYIVIYRRIFCHKISIDKKFIKTYENVRKIEMRKLIDKIENQL